MHVYIHNIMWVIVQHREMHHVTTCSCIDLIQNGVEIPNTSVSWLHSMVVKVRLMGQNQHNMSLLPPQS